jgi:surfactin synthase thioesterase subunit
MSKWFLRVAGASSRHLRLFCLHGAGSSASTYAKWSRYFPKAVEVVAIQLPGREGRFREAFSVSVKGLVRELAADLRGYTDLPYGIFGHSLGALIGFELVRELVATGARQPVVFMPAGRAAPHIKDQRQVLHRLSEGEFADALAKEKFLSPALRRALLEQDETASLFLPQMRADLCLEETYEYRASEPLSCPIVAYGGIEDPDVSLADLRAWAIHTTRHFRCHMLPGTHHFVQDVVPELTALVQHELSDSVAPVLRRI